MSMNAIQFQPGLSRPHFQALYGREQQCGSALVAARWLHGWRCARCACKRFFLTRLGVCYKTAWLLKHKLMQTMAQRDARYLLQGLVEIDDAYLGGERAGSINGGRKAANKSAFVAAVHERHVTGPGR